MLACVSPAYSSANHTINTLRYSDRLKEKSKNNGDKIVNTNNYEKIQFSNNVNELPEKNEIKLTNDYKHHKKEKIVKEKIERTTQSAHSARVVKFKKPVLKEENKIKTKKDMIFYNPINKIDETEFEDKINEERYLMRIILINF